MHRRARPQSHRRKIMYPPHFCFRFPGVRAALSGRICLPRSRRGRRAPAPSRAHIQRHLVDVGAGWARHVCLMRAYPLAVHAEHVSPPALLRSATTLKLWAPQSLAASYFPLWPSTFFAGPSLEMGAVGRRPPNSESDAAAHMSVVSGGPVQCHCTRCRRERPGFLTKGHGHVYPDILGAFRHCARHLAGGVLGGRRSLHFTARIARFPNVHQAR